MVGVDLEEKQSRKRQALLVLGMHRSGTSALTRVLSLLGCALPKTLLPENPTNPAGHWESWAVACFNDEVLSAAGSNWEDWLPVNDKFNRSLAYPDFVIRGGEVLTEEFGEAPLFVLKDPRICRLTQLWLDILEQRGVQPAIVVPVRNPLEVAESLQRRDGTENSIGLMMWLRHVLDVEKATRGRTRVFVSYAQLLRNWGLVADKIARGLDVVWPRHSQTSAAEISAFLTRDLHHNRRADDEVLHNPLITGWVSGLFQILLRWAEGSESKADYAAIDNIRHAFDEAGPLFSTALATLVNARRDLNEQLHHALNHGEALQRHIEDVQRQLAEQHQVVAGLVQERDDLAAQRDHVAQERNGLQQHANELNQQVTSVQEHAHALQSALDHALREGQEAAQRAAELSNQITAAQEHAEALQEALDQSLQEREHLLHRLGELESALLQRQEEARQVWSELEQTREQRDLAIADGQQALEGLRQTMLADVEESHKAASRVEQRAAEEMAQLQSMLDSAKSAIAEMERVHQAALADQVNRSLEEQLLLSQALAQAEQNRAVREQEIAQDNARIYDMLRQVEAEARALRGELDHRIAVSERDAEQLAALFEIRDQYDAVKLQKQQLERDLSERFGEIASLTQMMRGHEQRISQLVEQKAQAEGLAQDRHIWLQQRDEELAASHGRLHEVEAELGHKAGELAAMAAGKQRAEQQLAERFGEIAALTGMVRAQERKAQTAEQDREWLQQVYRAMDRKAWWWAYMPKAWQKAKIAARLARRGLFDADAYLARNPDVAQSGMDPLRHYMLHGIGEGRSRG